MPKDQATLKCLTIHSNILYRDTAFKQPTNPSEPIELKHMRHIVSNILKIPKGTLVNASSPGFSAKHKASNY